MKRLILDIDDTISRTMNGDYANAEVIEPVRRKIVAYRNAGFTIVLNSARNMQTYRGNTGKIAANTLPVLVKWLDKHDIPYDEIHLGKPWCGFEGFYVDDKAIRPDEFAMLDPAQIASLLEASKVRLRSIEMAADNQNTKAGNK